MEAVLDVTQHPKDGAQKEAENDGTHTPAPGRQSLGISLEGLQRVFGRDRRTIKTLSSALDPMGDDRANSTYDITDAASYLVSP